MTALKQQTWSI